MCERAGGRGQRGRDGKGMSMEVELAPAANASREANAVIGCRTCVARIPPS